MTTYAVTIAGSTKQILSDFKISETANGRNTLIAQILSEDGSYRPAVNADVTITEDATRIFGGLLNIPSEAGLGGYGVAAIVTSISCVDYNIYADRRSFSGIIPAGTLKSQLQVIEPYLTSYGVSLHGSQDTGPTNMPAVPCDDIVISELLNQLSTLSGGYTWEIDYNKKLRMKLPASTPAPFNITANDGNVDGDVTVEIDRSNYANRIILRYSVRAHAAYAFFWAGATPAQFIDTQTTTVGGVTYKFVNTLANANDIKIGSDWLATMNNLIAAIEHYPPGEGNQYGTGTVANPQVTAYMMWPGLIDVAARTPGVAGNSISCSDTCTNGADWVGEGVVPLDHLMYGWDEGLAPTVQANNLTEQALPNIGICEKKVDDPLVFDAGIAQANADALLVQCVNAITKKVTYSTFQKDIHPGQTQTITLPLRNLSGTFIITDVQISNIGNLVKRQVTATGGTTLGIRWQDTAKQIFSGGSGGNVSLLSLINESGGGGINGSGTIDKLAKWTNTTTLGDGPIVADVVLVSGSPTTGTLPKWASGTTLGNSLISESGGLVIVSGGLAVTGTGGLAVAYSVDLYGNLLPHYSWTSDIGTIDKKFRSLYAAELWVETLVAQQTLATIGGRVLVSPTTSLISDAAPGDGTIDVKHNDIVNGDRIFLESSGKAEWMYVTSGSTPITNGYRYSVQRDRDGSGANQWYAGDAVLNTRQTGKGFIDLYSIAGVLVGTGPTIVGNVRTGSDWNQVEPRWAIGNLKNVGYGAISTDIYGCAFGDPNHTWMSLNDTDGLVIRYGSGASAPIKMQISTSGVGTFAGLVVGSNGAGSALNPDTYFEDLSLWTLTDCTRQTGGGPPGKYYLMSNTGVQALAESVLFPIDRSDTFHKYRMSCWAYRTGTPSANGTLYLGVEEFDYQGNSLTTQYAITALTVLNDVFSFYSEMLGAFHTSTTHVRIRVAFNWAGNAGNYAVKCVRLEELVTSGLIVNGTVTANKMVLTPGGSVINVDPSFEDTSSWTLTSVSIVTLGAGVGMVGSKAAHGTGVTYPYISSVVKVPVSVQKTYRLHAYARARYNSDSTNDGVLYLGLWMYDAAMNQLGSYPLYPVAAVPVPNVWTKFEATVSGASFTANTAYVTPMSYLSYGNNLSGGWMELQDYRLEEMMPAELIVDGAIIAAKISVTTLAAINADLGAVTAGSIVVGSTNKLWFNDAGDPIFAIGGSTKASAPFRVTAAGALTATSATITGTITGSSIDSSSMNAGGVTLDSNGITIPSGGSGSAILKLGGKYIYCQFGIINLGSDVEISDSLHVWGASVLGTTVRCDALGSDTGTNIVISASGYLKTDSSSLRYKENVTQWKPANPYSILSLHPIRFDFIGGTKDVVGFAAEDLFDVDPACVNLDSDGHPDSIRQAALNVHLVEVIKALTDRLTVLEGGQRANN